MINIDEKKGQLKKISIAIILVLFLATIIITAQNIGEEIQTNNIKNQTTEAQENANLQNDDSKTTNMTNTNTDAETINDLCENINCSISTLICPDNFTATCENSCIEETGTCTSCIPSCEGHETTEQNQTENETETIGNETRTNETETEEGIENETTQPEQNITIPPGTGGIIIGNDTPPQLDIQLSYPEKITRGEIIEIKATITNSGAKAKKVIANWILPSDFEIISGNQIENCGNLNTQESCISTINIQTSSSTSLGKNQIKIAVSYEK